MRDRITFGSDTLDNAARRVDDFLAPRGRDGFADTIKPVPLGRTGVAEGVKEFGNWDESYEQGRQEVRGQR